MKFAIWILTYIPWTETFLAFHSSTNILKHLFLPFVQLTFLLSCVAIICLWKEQTKPSQAVGRMSLLQLFSFMQQQDFLLRYLCLCRLLRWEGKSHIVDCIWVSCLRADWWLDRKGVFCLKFRIMWKKKIVASQRHRVWDSRYLDVSSVFSVAVSIWR